MFREECCGGEPMAVFQCCDQSIAWGGVAERGMRGIEMRRSREASAAGFGGVDGHRTAGAMAGRQGQDFALATGAYGIVSAGACAKKAFLRQELVQGCLEQVSHE